jgi:hypothetical protein
MAAGADEIQVNCGNVKALRMGWLPESSTILAGWSKQ